MRIALQPAFILHSRPLNETSSLLEAFTESYGRVSLVARAARSRFRGILRPFTPLLISWSGKTELMNLSAVESYGLPWTLSGSVLLSGIYLNEMLVRLLPRFDAHPRLFAQYQQTLQCLQQQHSKEPSLRLFEKTLLTELGYGLSLNQEASGMPIVAEQSYVFIAGQGFSISSCGTSLQRSPVFQGSSLLAFHHNTLEHLADLRAAKQLTRLAIGSLLGNKPLKSRELFSYGHDFFPSPLVGEGKKLSSYLASKLLHK
ncbi:MAG TPA: DNA repair protein RecO [Gammaproteobacteria bacterium]|nr:DNA repair protein RecO [Gammaproteobacteria bacterium]